jgi:hypothetical protein
VRVGDDGLHLLEGVLAGLRVVTLREDSASCSNLDEVCAVFNIFANLMLDGGYAVGNTLTMDVVLEGEEVFVHVSAGDAKRRAGGLHMRAGDVASVNLITESHVSVVIRADVADGGKAGLERDLGVFNADDRLFGRGHREFVIRIEVRRHGEMSVDIDEARHHGVFG